MGPNFWNESVIFEKRLSSKLSYKNSVPKLDNQARYNCIGAPWELAKTSIIFKISDKTNFWQILKCESAHHWIMLFLTLLFRKCFKPVLPLPNTLEIIFKPSELTQKPRKILSKDGWKENEEILQQGESSRDFVHFFNAIAT